MTTAQVGTLNRRIAPELMSIKMTAALERASQLNSHNFGLVEGKDCPAPLLSPAGQYFYRCRNCKRSVFDDGSGTAAESTCKV